MRIVWVSYGECRMIENRRACFIFFWGSVGPRRGLTVSGPSEYKQDMHICHSRLFAPFGLERGVGVVSGKHRMLSFPPLYSASDIDYQILLFFISQWL